VDRLSNLDPLCPRGGPAGAKLPFGVNGQLLRRSKFKALHVLCVPKVGQPPRSTRGMQVARECGSGSNESTANRGGDQGVSVVV
jgi:hypothetical protein